MSFNVKINSINDEKRLLLNEFINVTREMSSLFNNDKKVMTEQITEVGLLLNLLEKIICHGLKNQSILSNVLDVLSTSTSSNNGNLFWSFASQFLTRHEQERFSSYKNLWTDRGKTKALIRNALNERCLERYLLTWLSAHNLNDFYEPHSLLRDEKASAILPKLASDLSSILFAISIDVPELNVASGKLPSMKPEPIIAVPNSSKAIKSTIIAQRRNIDEFEETVKTREQISRVLEPTFENVASTSTINENILKSNDEISVASSSASLDLKDEDTISQSSASSSNVSQQAEPPEVPTSIGNQMNDVNMIQKQRERILELENKLSELVIENNRLKNLLNSTKLNTLGNFQISIPRAILQKTKTNNYYIYEINIRSKDETEAWTIFKRYRDFHQLHKKLKKQYLQIKVLDFPPKKKIGNLDFDFVEERRQRLQIYIRHVLQNLPELAHCDSRILIEAKCSFFKS